MHFFLTGGTGFLGSHFLSVALADGYRVTALRRPGSHTRFTLGQEPNWCEGSLDDDWSHILSDCDVLVHLAAAGVWTDKDNWDYCFQVNVSQTLDLLRQAINSGITKFLICGSCFEYGLTSLDYSQIPVNAPLHPTDAYSASKAAATMAAMGLANCFNLRLVVVRPFHLFGEGEAATKFWPSLVRAAKAGEDFPMSGGAQIRDFMCVEDAAQAILCSIHSLDKMTVNASIENIGTGVPQSLLEFAEDKWAELKAKGALLPGTLPYRTSETMRYVPLIERH